MNVKWDVMNVRWDEANDFGIYLYISGHLAMESESEVI